MGWGRRAGRLPGGGHIAVTSAGRHPERVERPAIDEPVRAARNGAVLSPATPSDRKPNLEQPTTIFLAAILALVVHLTPTHADEIPIEDAVAEDARSRP